MMWRYAKKLSSEESIKEFEWMVGLALPESFKACVRDCNGARPKRRLFDTEQTSDRVLKSLLSFNRSDKENVWWAYLSVEAAMNGACIPFAVDAFGNFICFNRAKEVVFVDHETLGVEKVAGSFDAFLYGLRLDADYFRDVGNGNVVRRIPGYGIECLERGSDEWRYCGAGSNYYRELFLGEGNNCLDAISEEEALQSGAV